jgi:holo-[acyl-carrier protein] synthase
MILGIGSDLIDCRRIEASINRFGDRFLNRVFTAQERLRINQRVERAAGYASLFAMKEAILKALGTGLAKGIAWHDIEIFREPQQAPHAALSGKALERLKSRTLAGYTAEVHITASDEWPYAQAFAIVSIKPKLISGKEML